MSGTINLVERLLTRARTLAHCGRRRDARVLLERLITFGDSAVETRCEVHLLLADLYIDLHKFRKARRQIAAVLALRPNDADALYRMAMAVDMDPDAEPARAWKLLRKAVRLMPEDARLWSAHGQLALRLGKRATALRSFRTAAGLAPDAVAVLEEIAEGLVTLERAAEARDVLTSARFRLPTQAVDRLRNRFEFNLIHRRQRAGRFSVAAGAGRAVLPFVRLADSPGKGFGTGILRDDRFSKATPHLQFREANRPDPRRAT